MRKLSTLFYSLNMALFLIGIHLWLAYSIMRIVILYSIFNIILFSMTGNDDKYDTSTRRVVPARLFQFLAAVLVILLAWTTVGFYLSLYARPSFFVAVLGITIVFFMVVLLVSCGQSPSTESFALLAAIFIVLIAGFGIYLAQPNLTNSPYSSNDAYREYANAVRILSLSRVDPGTMIGTPYYRAFPVEALEIASMSLLAGLPANISHLILATVADGLAVTSLFLLSKRVAGNYARSCSCLLLLPVLLIFLQPMLMDPVMLVQPIRMSIPIVTLIVYLTYKQAFSLRPTGSFFVMLILLFMIIVPLHAAAAAFAILIIGMLAFTAGSGRARESLSLVGLLGLVFSFLYFFYTTTSSYTSVFTLITNMWKMLSDILRLGTALVPKLASKQLGPQQQALMSETDSFLLSTSWAFIISVFTIFVVKILKARSNVVKGVRQRSFYIMLGLLLFIGFTMGLPGYTWEVDTRYLTFPLTPAAVIAATMVIVWALRDMTARRKLLLIGLLSLCILSMLTSPAYRESSPSYIRTTPIESERVTVTFVVIHFDRYSDITQIVTDWPYNSEVEGVLESRYVGIEDTVLIPTLVYDWIPNCHSGHSDSPRGTEMLYRRYFAESVIMQNAQPYSHTVGPLTNDSAWSHFNRIYDDYSVSLHIGRLTC